MNNGAKHCILVHLKLIAGFNRHTNIRAILELAVSRLREAECLT